ncbi:MAG: 3-oxoacyl-[acyl-carrier-protein] synthase III C-terminal domain-containing protein, partial [bacterium]
IPAGGSATPITREVLDRNLQYMQMDGSKVFKIAVRKMQEAAVEALEEAGMPADELDWVICHQANVRIINAVEEKLGLPREKMIINIDKYGNTSAASIPLAFDEARNDGRIESGDTILKIAFGGGLTWASSIMTLP